MFDIAIIGAGPAGATLARLVGRQYKVLLIDRRPLQKTVDITYAGKCCGGLLAPDAQQVLGAMGLALPQSVLVSPQLFVVRTIDLATNLERHYQRFYLNLNREAFDRWLVSLLPPSVELRTETMFMGAQPNDAGFDLSIMHQGRVYHEQTRLLIGADGANSLVRRLIMPGHRVSSYLAVQEWFAAEAALPYFTAVFDPRLTDFYAWTIPKENYLLLGAALPVGRDPLARFQALKQRLAAKGFDFSRQLKREGCLVLRPRSRSEIAYGAGKALLLGEAAGWISPSSAEGFSYALRSAGALAEALSSGLTGTVDRYRARTKGLATNLLLKNLKSPLMYQPRLRNLVLRSGLLSTDVPGASCSEARA